MISINYYLLILTTISIQNIIVHLYFWHSGTIIVIIIICNVWFALLIILRIESCKYVFGLHIDYLWFVILTTNFWMMIINVFLRLLFIVILIVNGLAIIAQIVSKDEGGRFEKHIIIIIVIIIVYIYTRLAL